MQSGLPDLRDGDHLGIDTAFAQNLQHANKFSPEHAQDQDSVHSYLNLPRILEYSFRLDPGTPKKCEYVRYYWLGGIKPLFPHPSFY